jgi:hypothetical protein
MPTHSNRWLVPSSVVVGAGMLAASYQIAHDEGQTLVQGLRDSARQRRSRNNALMLALVGTALPLRLLQRMHRSRDVFRECMTMVTNPAIPTSIVPSSA